MLHSFSYPYSHSLTLVLKLILIFALTLTVIRSFLCPCAIYKRCEIYTLTLTLEEIITNYLRMQKRLYVSIEFAISDVHTLLLASFSTIQSPSLSLSLSSPQFQSPCQSQPLLKLAFKRQTYTANAWPQCEIPISDATSCRARTADMCTHPLNVSEFNHTQQAASESEIAYSTPTSAKGFLVLSTYA